MKKRVRIHKNSLNIAIRFRPLTIPLMKRAINLRKLHLMLIKKVKMAKKLKTRMIRLKKMSTKCQRLSNLIVKMLKAKKMYVSQDVCFC